MWPWNRCFRFWRWNRCAALESWDRCVRLWPLDRSVGPWPWDRCVGPWPWGRYVRLWPWDRCVRFSRCTPDDETSRITIAMHLAAHHSFIHFQKKLFHQNPLIIHEKARFMIKIYGFIFFFILGLKCFHANRRGMKDFRVGRDVGKATSCRQGGADKERKRK